MLDKDQTWNLIKVIASLVHVETNRNDVIKPEQTKWEGFTLTPQDLETRLVVAGINGLPNLGERAQTPEFVASLHAMYLEKTTNSLGLLRIVDGAVGDNANDEGKKLKGISQYMGKEDPVLAVETLCHKVILTCTFISAREKLARNVGNSIEAYETKRGELMEIAHGSLDGKFPAQVASERLMEVKKTDREIKLQSHKFYSYLPVTDLQRVAVEKLTPLVPVLQEWHFQDVLNVTTAETPIFTTLEGPPH